MKTLFSNWKTTLGSLLAAIATVGPLLHFISPEQAASILGLAATFGLAAAQDAKKQ